MEEVKCYIPESLDEALKIRKETGATVLAGGTDLMVQHYSGTDVSPEFSKPIVIISNLEELKGIKLREDGKIEIGALATSADIASSSLVPYLVRAAASKMGAISLRNSATIGGNIGNASPKGDLPQPLILLDAEVVLKSVDGERVMLVDEFIKGAKKTMLQDDEIITAILIKPQDFTYYMYHKIGTRRANAISKLSISIVANVEDGVVTDFRASSGATGPKVARSREVEHMLIGLTLDKLQGVKEDFLNAYNTVISPHAMPEWRRNSTRRMLAYFIDKISEGAAPGEIS